MLGSRWSGAAARAERQVKLGAVHDKRLYVPIRKRVGSQTPL